MHALFMWWWRRKSPYRRPEFKQPVGKREQPKVNEPGAVKPTLYFNADRRPATDDRRMTTFVITEPICRSKD
ncbi:unnamed protein product [Soboliphyme baturini]|uniref:Secreted protein n=1 Tax=Soboliphyme baturini TaxID=241478 RepID=A0A183J5H3_9BILA|nr:unnamed protein product [Soboliphyme baturini]